MKTTHIFPIKKGRGSFEKSQQYHWSYFALVYVLVFIMFIDQLQTQN